MDIKKLNEELVKIINEEDNTIQNVFGYLPLKQDVSSEYIAPGNNDIHLRLEKDKFKGSGDSWNNSYRVSIELSPENCKDKETLLNILKDKGIFHKETEDIARCAIDEGDNFIILYGLVNKQNKNINLVKRPGGGRGVSDYVIKNRSEDAIIDAIQSKGLNVSKYEIIKQLPEGTLVLASIRPYDTKKTFIVKDEDVKTIGLAGLCKIIKNS